MSKIDDLIKSFRSGETRIDLDHAELLLPDSGPVTLSVPVFITVRDRRLLLHLRESAPHQLPPAALSAFAKGTSGTVITSTEFLSINALTEQGLPVRLAEINPLFSRSPSSFVNGGGAVTHREIRFHRLSLLPIGLTPAERRAENIAVGVIKPDQPSGFPEDAEESFSALIPAVKLKLFNSGITTTTKHPYHRREGFSGNTACYTGTILNGEFCLEQTDSGDLAVSFRRSSRTTGPTPSLQKISGAFMAAVGLLHSCNPWPYYYNQWHERRLVERWLKAPADCQRDCIEPVRLFIHDENAELFFKTAVTFFASEEADVEYYRQTLWLMREACRKGVPMEIRLLTLCSVLEGLHKRNFSAGNSKRERWQNSFAKAGVPWNTHFDAMFDSWEDYRNKLAHGFDPHPADEQSPDLVFNAYSRITAGIYILMAKRMGFTGTLWRSKLEGDVTISLATPTPA